MQFYEIIPVIRQTIAKKTSRFPMVWLGTNVSKPAFELNPNDSVEDISASLTAYIKRSGVPRSIAVEGRCIHVSMPKRLPVRTLEGRVAVVTGAAGGLGLQFAMMLLDDGASVVLADSNEQKLTENAAGLGIIFPKRSIFHVPVDVRDYDSVVEMVRLSVERFGAIDLLISDAGVVRAGSTESMSVEDFALSVDVNYKGYFNVVKAVAPIMKIQTSLLPDYYADIVQINSKSGLRGSRNNFAYSGSKFGGIGLTQSFALELAPFRIKVNSICPGNWYEGELWSNPEKGLFVEYLRAGKVPGATCVEDVRQHYISQSPMRKGCTPEELYRAIVYAVEQTGETGQSIPVTGGQVMLS